MTDSQTIWQIAGITPAQAVHRYDQGEAKVLEYWRQIPLEQKKAAAAALSGTTHGTTPVIVTAAVYGIILMAASVGFNRLLILDNAADAAE